MSDMVLLSIGFAVFFVTVYGVVVLSGLKLVQKRIDQEPELGAGYSADDLKHPSKIEY